jgi:hypothetical protein
MEAIKKEKRKIRKEIRKAAEESGLTTDEYREQNSIDSKEIHRIATQRLGEYRVDSDEKRDFETLKKTYDPLSNTPKYSSLKFGRPIVRIARNATYHFDHIVWLAENGHYLPFSKLYREVSGEAHTFEV